VHLVFPDLSFSPLQTCPHWPYVDLHSVSFPDGGGQTATPPLWNPGPFSPFPVPPFLPLPLPRRTPSSRKKIFFQPETNIFDGFSRFKIFSFPFPPQSFSSPLSFRSFLHSGRRGDSFFPLAHAPFPTREASAFPSPLSRTSPRIRASKKKRNLTELPFLFFSSLTHRPTSLPWRSDLSFRAFSNAEASPAFFLYHSLYFISGPCAPFHVSVF